MYKYLIVEDTVTLFVCCELNFSIHCYLLHQDIHPSLILWGIFSAAFELFLVEFSFVYVPYLLLIYVRLQKNKYLHVV